MDKIEMNFVGAAEHAASKEMMRRIGRACALYYIMVGGLYNVVNTAMVDACNELKQHPKWWRFETKRDVNASFAAYERWQVKMKVALKDRFGLWLDMSDDIDEKFRMDVMKMRVSMANYLLKMDEPEATLRSHLELASTLMDMTEAAIGNFFDSCRRQIGRDLRHAFVGGDMSDIRRLWQAAILPIMRTQNPTKVVDFNDDEQCRLSARVIANRMGNATMYNQAGEYALQMNPQHWHYLEQEDQETLKRGGHFCTGKDDAPTETQLTALQTKFQCHG